MPIRFRCPHCERLLGIATRKAGAAIACPQCSGVVTVPRPAGDGPVPKELDEIDELLGFTGAEPVRAQPQVKVAPPPPKKQPRPADSLFETGDVDDLLGLPSPLPAVTTPPSAPKPAAGTDVRSRDDTQAFVTRKVVLLVVGVALLLLAAFGGGYLIASAL